MSDADPTIREQMDEVMWRERTPAELIEELGNTYRDALPLRIHILLGQAARLLLEQSEMPATIVRRIRENCTPSAEAYRLGGDHLVRAVADWIEDPPAWVNAPWRSRNPFPS